MNKEEATARVAAQSAELAGLEADISRLAQLHTAPVFLAIMRGLVEMVCGAQGEVFRVHNKIKFYRGVLAILRHKGIS